MGTRHSRSGRSRGRKATLAGAAFVGLVGLVTGTLTAYGAPVASTDAVLSAVRGETGADTGQAVRRITLITGDTVSLDVRGKVTRVTPGAGRTGIPAFVHRFAGHTYVLPADVDRLLAEGRLDRRLFDVTRLATTGYDDAHRGGVPLIVSYAPGAAQRSARQALRAADADIRRQLPIVRGESVNASKGQVGRVFTALTDPLPGRSGTVTIAPGVDRVWLDSRREAHVSQDGVTTAQGHAKAPGGATAPDPKGGPVQIGAPQAWKAGYDGKGVKVAVLDTGVDATHADLKGVVAGTQDFTGGGADDRSGHGTHVASIIAGSGRKSGGRYIGVAPGARLLVGKVMNDGGDGDESAILAGMQWAVKQKAKIVNLSLSDVDVAGDGPVEKAVNDLSKSSGTLFTVAAGNKGPDEGTLASPGSAEQALTVAAVDHADRLAGFSGRGPTADDALKPDLSAPGVDVVAAKAAHGRPNDEVAPGYVAESGTSMAAPAAAGAAAILAQEHPDWTGQRIKAALMASSKPLAGQSAYGVGAGRVDLTRAIGQTVSTEPASLGFGIQRWPHADDRAVHRTLTYRNSGDRPVTLDLSLSDEAGPDGRSAAPGLFRVSPARLTVPAGGTAKATVTADTHVDGLADGLWSATVTATGAAQRVRTPVGVVREPESHELILKVIGRDGKPHREPNVIIAGLDNGRIYAAEPARKNAKNAKNAKVSVRLPKGRFTLDAKLGNPDGAREGFSWLVAPRLTMDRDRTLTLDARTAKPIRVKAPDKRAELRGSQVVMVSRGSSPYYDYSSGGPLSPKDLSGTYFAQVGPTASAKDFIAQYAGQYRNGATDPEYDLVVTRRGGMFTGLDRTVSARGLAKVVTATGSVTTGTRATPSLTWTVDGWQEPLRSVVNTFDGPTRKAPYTGIRYVSAGDGLRWQTIMALSSGAREDLGALEGAARRYQPGRTHRESFNTAVFGPALPPGDHPEYFGRDYAICVPMFSDGAGHTGDSGASVHARFTTGGTTLAGPGDDVCTDGHKKLPDHTARYRLSLDATRSASVYRVGTRSSVVWDFTLRPIAEDSSAKLPLSVVRFAPGSSLTGTAKAGTRLTVPVLLQGPAAAPGALKSLDVKVSYDGGRTWKNTSAHTAPGGKRTITLTHPSAPGTVSLKAVAEDNHGNKVTETLLNAYRTVG